MMKKKWMSFLLTLALFFPVFPPFAAAASADSAGLSAGTYSVPLAFFYCNTINTVYGKEQSTNAQTLNRVQMYERATVTVNDAGEVAVRIPYHSFKFFQPENGGFIQAVDPGKMEDVKAVSTGIEGLKAGYFDNYTTVAAAITAGGKTPADILSADNNSYFLGEDKFQTVPALEGSVEHDMNMGYITLRLDSLPDSLYLKTMAPLRQMTSAGILTCGIRIDFMPSLAIPIPEASTYFSDEPKEMFTNWTNVTLEWSAGNPYSPGRNAALGRGALNAMIAEKASVAKNANGTLTATFALAEGASVHAVSRAVSRNVTTDGGLAINADLAYGQRILSEQYNTEFEPVEVEDTGGKRSFSLTYADLEQGVLLRVQTAETPGSIIENNIVVGYVYDYYAWLRLDAESPAPAGSLTNNGVTISYSAGIVPANAAFTATTLTESWNAEAYNKYRGIAHTTQYYQTYANFYALSLQGTGSGNITLPAGDVSLTFTVPSSWNMEKLIFLRLTSDSVSTNMSGATLDKTQRTLTYRLGAGDDIYNTVYFLAQQATPINISSGLADGLYDVDVLLLHKDYFQPSMSAGVIKDNKGYLEVKDGKGKLFFTMRGILPKVSGGDIGGNLTQIFTLDGVRTLADPSKKAETEYLSFYTNEAGDSIYADDMAAADRVAYPKTLSFSLVEPLDDIYWLSFIVPPMGYYETPVRLLVKKATKLADAANNPLAGYDKSVILAAINDAGNAIAALDATADAERIAGIQTAIASAQAAWADASIDTDAEIVAARDALRAAVGDTDTGVEDYGKIGDTTSELAAGSYDIDAELWNFSENKPSMGNGALKASKVTVAAPGEATLHLEFGALTWGDFTGHLQNLWLATDIVKDEDGIIQSYGRTPTTILSTYAGTADATDLHGPRANGYDTQVPSAYPKEISLPITVGRAYTDVVVFVPVMDAISAGSGTQLARIRIDWTALGLAQIKEVTPAPLAPATAVAAGTASAAVDETAVAAVIAAAKAGYSEGELVPKISEVTVNVAPASGDAYTAVKLDVSVDAVEAVIAEDAKLTVNSDIGTVTLVKDALAEILSGAPSDAASVAIRISADASAALTPAQASAIPADKVPFAIEISVDGASVTGELASEIAVTIPYAKAPAEGKKLVVYYVAADGSKTKHDASHDTAKGKLTFTTDRI
ncbi:MAG: hypothetical protein LBE16_01650 [Clostridiales Family XIII bacterium]|jgi:hypothetical protein|nr:hypothetical protein [Clostridiales Family XIII bacterium]